jgi:hypothetical protein
MNASRLLRRAALALAAAALLAGSAPGASASHFRYGTMKWEITRDGGGTIDLKVTTECAWRRSYFNPQVIVVGSVVDTLLSIQVQTLPNGTIHYSQPLMIVATAVDPTNDWFVGSATFNFAALPKAELPMRVFWLGGARIDSLQDGNNGRNFRLETVVPADTSNLFSPSAGVLPIVNVPFPFADATFLLPAADADGDAMSWSIASTPRSLLFRAAPDGADDTGGPELRIDADTGRVHWNTASELTPPPDGHLYAVQFVVADARGAEIPVDVLFRLVPDAGTPPVAKIDGLETPYSIEVNPGTPVSFTLSGEDADFGATVTLGSGGIPIGAAMTPSLPFSGTPPRSSVFAWTPTPAQAGSHVMQFAVTDQLAQQDTISATVIVRDNLQPKLSCPLPASAEAAGPGGASHTAQATVFDPDGDDVAVRWLVGGVLEETDHVPGGGSAVVDFTRTYGLGTHQLRIEARDGITPATVCETSVTVADTIAPVVDQHPALTVPATGPGGAVVTFTVTARDNPPVDPSPIVTCVPASGSTFAIGSHTVSCTAKDFSNNVSAPMTFTVSVLDTPPPPVVVTLSPRILWPPNHKMVRVDVRVAWEPGATCAITSVTSNEPVDGRGDGNTPAYDWLFGPGLNLKLRAERQGPGRSRIYTVTVACTGAQGGVGTGTATAICPHDMGAPGPPGPSLIRKRR